MVRSSPFLGQKHSGFELFASSTNIFGFRYTTRNTSSFQSDTATGPDQVHIVAAQTSTRKTLLHFSNQEGNFFKSADGESEEPVWYFRSLTNDSGGKIFFPGSFSDRNARYYCFGNYFYGILFKDEKCCGFRVALSGPKYTSFSSIAIPVSPISWELGVNNDGNVCISEYFSYYGVGFGVDRILFGNRKQRKSDIKTRSYRLWYLDEPAS